jgi:hypothetical protein
MKYYLQCDNQLGTTHQVIINDLKTKKGIINRILKGSYPYGLWKVYKYIISSENGEMLFCFNK